MNTPFRVRCAAQTFVVGLLLLSTARSWAQSSSISQVTVFTLGWDASSTLNFTPFDGAMGTLQSVDLTITGLRRNDFVYWSNDLGHSSSTIQIGYGLSGETFTVTDTGGSGTPAAISIPDLAPTSTSTTLTNITSAVAQSQSAAAAAVFTAGGTPNPPDGYQLFQTTPFGSDLALPLSFSGALLAAYNSGSIAMDIGTTGGTSTTLLMSDVSGTAELTYTFVPIPEPASAGIWLGAAALGFGFLRRRRKI